MPAVQLRIKFSLSLSLSSDYEFSLIATRVPPDPAVIVASQELGVTLPRGVEFRSIGLNGIAVKST